MLVAPPLSSALPTTSAAQPSPDKAPSPALAVHLAPGLAAPLGCLELAEPGHGQLDVADHGRDHLRLWDHAEQLLLARRQLRAALQQLHRLWLGLGLGCGDQGTVRDCRRM